MAPGAPASVEVSVVSALHPSCVLTTLLSSLLNTSSTTSSSGASARCLVRQLSDLDLAMSWCDAADGKEMTGPAPTCVLEKATAIRILSLPSLSMAPELRPNRPLRFLGGSGAGAYFSSNSSMDRVRCRVRGRSASPAVGLYRESDE